MFRSFQRTLVYNVLGVLLISCCVTIQTITSELGKEFMGEDLQEINPKQTESAMEMRSNNHGMRSQMYMTIDTQQKKELNDDPKIKSDTKFARPFGNVGEDPLQLKVKQTAVHMGSQSHKKTTTKLSAKTKAKILEELDMIPFYMYDDPDITLDTQFTRLFERRLKRIGAEMLYDLATIKSLKESTWRTNDPDEAKLYIIPTPMGKVQSSVNHELYDLAFNALLNHTVFKRTYGHNNVIIATPFLLFRGDKQLNGHGMMNKWLPYLWNTTVASSWDQNAISNALQENFDFKDYSRAFRRIQPLTRKTFSVGLSGGTNFPLKGLHMAKTLDIYNFPLTLATIEKFNNSSNFIFYHTPLGHVCTSNSTIHRNAPVTNITLDEIPKSSIGNGIVNRNEWYETFRDSKFCLCIRGDSPHSHALFRSIRSGCIPVISSEFLPIFSPIFKNTLDMNDYAIMLNEDDLIQDTQKTLMKLSNLDRGYIERKIQHLQFAQRVLFHDHPDSLFVKAFLKESLHASEVDDLMNPYKGK